MRTMTRKEAVDAMRAKLLEVCDDEHSICEIAAQRNIFCHGFAQWTFGELKKRYPTIVRSRPAITPQELLDYANRWQLCRQTVRDSKIACDLQLDEGALRTCRGWDEWPNADLARFYRELFGEEVELVGRETR